MRRGVGGRVRRLRVAAIPAVFVFLASCASNAPQDTLDPDGPIANKQNNLFLFVFVIAAVVFVLVQGLLIATIVRHRHRPGRPDPIQVHGNTKLEFGWTAVPALLLVGVAFPTVFTIFDIAKEPHEERAARRGLRAPVVVGVPLPDARQPHDRQRAPHPDQHRHPAEPPLDRAGPAGSPRARSSPPE